MSTESKVGLFFFVGVIILGVVTFRVQDLSKFTRRTYTVKACFSSAGGLEEGNPVALAGVKVGNVKSIAITPDGVEVTMEIKQGTVIRQDSEAAITLGGLLGDKYIDISLGNKELPALKDGDTVPNQNPPDLNAMIAKVVKAVNAVSDFTASFAEGQDFFKSLKEAGPKLTSTLDALQEITAKIKAGEGTIGKLVNDDEIYKKADQIATSLRSASERLDRIIGDNEEEIHTALVMLKDTAPQIKKAVANLEDISTKIQSGEGTIGKLVNDPQVFDDLRSALADVKELTEKMKKGDSELARFVDNKKFFEDLQNAVASLNSVAMKIDKGEGTVGKLINDPTLFEEMKKVIQEGREAVRGAKEQIPVGAFTSVVFGAF